ncbi:MAG: MATE family efflux transporter [Erysipelotrichaceae bacterium]|nr:MATE family efflux transporter [Erysipelotrichaceae bacterium]
MSETKTYDTGALFKETIRMAWPALLESFFVALAGMIDTMMVSAMGTYAVAAVGLTTQPKFITLAIFFSINVSVSALVARRRGQQDQRSANEILLTALILTLLFCAILSVITVIWASPIISLCGSNADTHESAVLYFRVIQAGMIFNVLSLCINAAQRGSGNTKIAMTTNITSSIVNIIFNYLLIGGNFGFPKWGVFGAAFATVLGTVAASIMSVRSLFNPNSYVSIPFIRREKIRSQGESLLSILKLGSNMLVENIAMRVGFVTTAVMAAKLGTDAFAAHQVGMNFLSLGFSFGDGMQVAAVALIGRSLGENDPDKARVYGRLCQRTGLGISFVLAIILFFFGRNLFSLFFTDLAVLDMGVLISKYIIVIILFQISQIIFGGCLRGAGDMRYCLFASLISVTLIRTAVTWGLTSVFALGLHGIWIGILSDQLSRFIFLSLRFKEGSWAKIRI